MSDIEQERPFLLECWHLDGQLARPGIATERFEADHWYHCQRQTGGIREWLLANEVISPVADALLDDDTRPRFDHLPEGFMLNLRGVNLNEGSPIEDMISLRILWFNNSLVTLRRQPLKSVQTVLERLREQRGPARLPSVLIAIIEELNQRIDDALDQAEQQLEIVEANNSYDSLSLLTQLHRRLLRLNRFIRPQVGALERFSNAALDFWTERDSQRLLNERDTTQRSLETVDMLLAQIAVIRDEIHQIGAERLNKNTYWLSVIAGVFLPLGFLTGLFGMNLGGMPGIDSDTAFYWTCGVMAIIAVLEFVLLRRLKFW